MNANVVPQLNALVAARTGLALHDQRLDVDEKIGLLSATVKN